MGRLQWGDAITASIFIPESLISLHAGKCTYHFTLYGGRHKCHWSWPDLQALGFTVKDYITRRDNNFKYLMKKSIFCWNKLNQQNILSRQLKRQPDFKEMLGSPLLKERFSWPIFLMASRYKMSPSSVHRSNGRCSINWPRPRKTRALSMERLGFISFSVKEIYNTQWGNNEDCTLQRSLLHNCQTYGWRTSCCTAT